MEGFNMDTVDEETRAMLLQLMELQRNARNPTIAPKADLTDEKTSQKITATFEFLEKDPIEAKIVEIIGQEKKSGAWIGENLTDIIFREGIQETNYQDYLKCLYKGKPIKNGLCRKVLNPKTDIGYICLDCQKDPTCIICQSCFEKGDHRGHR